jgi:hypothetical protein
MALGSTQPLVKMSTRIIPGGKGGQCVRLTTSPPSRAECHEMRQPKPHGTLWHTGPVTGLLYLFTALYLTPPSLKFDLHFSQLHDFKNGGTSLIKTAKGSLKAVNIKITSYWNANTCNSQMCTDVLKYSTVRISRLWVNYPEEESGSASEIFPPNRPPGFSSQKTVTLKQ